MNEKAKNLVQKEKRLMEMEQEVNNLQLYVDCITRNSDAIVKALRQNNFGSIEKILSESGIPKNRTKGMMRFILDSFNGHHEPW